MEICASYLSRAIVTFKIAQMNNWKVAQSWRIAHSVTHSSVYELQNNYNKLWSYSCWQGQIQSKGQFIASVWPCEGADGSTKERWGRVLEYEHINLPAAEGTGLHTVHIQISEVLPAGADVICSLIKQRHNTTQVPLHTHTFTHKERYKMRFKAAFLPKKTKENCVYVSKHEVSQRFRLVFSGFPPASLHVYDLGARRLVWSQHRVNTQ